MVRRPEQRGGERRGERTDLSVEAIGAVTADGEGVRADASEIAFDGVLGGPAALTNAEVEETIARLLADC